ncbi:MAG: Vi polysaccharide biosynthesis UDP-N-acetylglucosamine C-6 dehydrogenase TviB, partial [Gammaproteobacteria bacterium]|nr:Vi polysaccharide biosynthesis UDP-N-acetylglucosamine C-6 dehydrogenase TviB [Gammaproteobacteria bacterium]
MTNFKKIDDARVTVVGLGYVGLPLAVEFGRHLDTVGFDIDPKRIADLRAGNDFTLETDTEELKAAKHLKFTTELEALRGRDVYIVTVPTPIDAAKRPDISALRAASRTVGQVLGKGAIVVYESTVYPGCTEEDCAPILEQVSGLKLNQDFFVGYSP